MQTKKESTRAGFGRGLVRVTETNPKVIVSAADTYRSFNMQSFVSQYPERYFEFGICEQNMIAASAAMAGEGYTVFTVGYSTFLSMRALEQIRTFVAHPIQNVKIVAGIAGLAGATCGVTHQGTEDIPIIRSIPNLKFVCPADSVAAEKMTIAVTDDPAPYYIRLGRSATDIVYDENETFEIGKAKLPRTYGDQFTIIATGPCVCEAVKAADTLHEMGIEIRVVDMHTITPIDTDQVIACAKQTRNIITAEDGSIQGGLGSAVAEILMENGISVDSFKRLGMRTFGFGGALPDLLAYFGVDAVSMVREICAKLGMTE